MKATCPHCNSDQLVRRSSNRDWDLVAVEAIGNDFLHCETIKNIESKSLDEETYSCNTTNCPGFDAAWDISDLQVTGSAP